MVYFEIFDALEERVLAANLGDATFAQYSTASLANGVYYWRLKDYDRTIKAGKLVIIK